MFKMILPNGTELAVVRENGIYNVQVDGHTFFSHTVYEKAREVLIA